MEKRVTFNERWLPYLLVAPQIVVTLVFFFWPAGQASGSRCCIEDAFGGNTRVRLVRQFRAAVADDPAYCASVARHRWSSARWWPSIGLGVSLLLAVMADRIVRGATVYKTFLVWPYAVAPAVAGVLWRLPVQSLGRHRRLAAAAASASTGTTCSTATRRCCWSSSPRSGSRSATTSCSSSPACSRSRKSLIEAAAIDGAGPGRRFWDDHLPAALADRRSSCWWSTSSTPSSTPSAIIDALTKGGPGQATDDPGLQGLQRRLQRPRPRRLGGAVGDPDGRSSSR